MSGGGEACYGRWAKSVKKKSESTEGAQVYETRVVEWKDRGRFVGRQIPTCMCRLIVNPGGCMVHVTTKVSWLWSTVRIRFKLRSERIKYLHLDKIQPPLGVQKTSPVTVTPARRTSNPSHGMNGSFRCHNPITFRLHFHPRNTSISHSARRQDTPRFPSRGLCGARHMSWAARLNMFSRAQDTLEGRSQGEEAVRTAILEKVLKGGRQPPADLMLRCKLSFPFQILFYRTIHALKKRSDPVHFSCHPSSRRYHLGR